MRGLYKKQKKILYKWFEQNKENIGLSFKAEHLPTEIFEELERINDFETINAEIEGYVCDLLGKED